MTLFGVTVAETRAFAMKALERRMKVIGLRQARLADPRAERHVAAGASRITLPSSSEAPSVEHLRHERADLARREVDDRDDEAALELARARSS